jgi:hypothetical protein
MVLSMLVSERNSYHVEPEIELQNASDMVSHIRPAVRYVGADDEDAAGS